MEDLSTLKQNAASSPTLAPRPATLAETGLSQEFVRELIVRTLYARGAHALLDLSKSVALAGNIIEPVIQELRRQAQVESTAEAGRQLYRLTGRGREMAREAFARCGYVGPAPVPLSRYGDIAAAQSFRGRLIRRDTLRRALRDAVVDADLLDTLGPALHSARPALLYGPAGTGKTFIAKQLIRAFDDTILIPHAVLAGGDVIRVYDPTVHRRTDSAAAAVSFAHGEDPRFVRCERPLLVTGGELTLDMLELRYGSEPAVATAPVQMKSTNGLLLIDDLGRQRVAPDALFNRWIVPLEEGRDYLVDSSGHHTAVPFETLLLFSTNMAPKALADDAFLRRLGQKIRFAYCTKGQFEAIWSRACSEAGIRPGKQLLEHLLREYYTPSGRPLAPCHPRDLVELAVSYARYRGDREPLSEASIRWAWHAYFINSEAEGATC